MKNRKEVLEEVERELDNCLLFIKNKINKLDVKDLNHPDMKGIDWIHDACHTLMLPQGGRGPIPSMSELRDKNK